MKIPKNRNGLRGFTLVETAIVVTVGAIILSAGLSGYKTYLQKERYDTTKERLSKIAKALDDYRKLPSNVNHNIPCPAPLYAAPGSAGYGHDVTLNPTTGLPLPVGQQCDDAPASGLLGTERRKSGTSGVEKDVRIGAVPFATLGLSAEDTQDAWGQRFIYAVSEPLANYATPYSASGGTITVLDGIGVPIGGVGLANKIPFFVYTSGKNGGGGITADGSNFYNACPSTGLDSLNCAWKATALNARVDFRSTTYSESGGATEFDDQIIYDYTDDDLVTKCNDLSDCISDNASFIYLGEGAGNTTTAGPKNTAMGINSLAANTIGNLNTAMGWSALQNNTSAVGNSAFGSSALQQNTTGGFNTAMGLNALTANTTAVGNSAFGSSALSSNTTGTDNTAMGLRALTANNGSNNVAVGSNALEHPTTGIGNVAIGAGAARGLSGPAPLGDNNTAVGYEAFYHTYQWSYLTIPASNNTAVGAGALKYGATQARNNVGIGSGALSGTNNFSGPLLYRGNDNTAVGTNALQRSNHGMENTAVGTNALQNLAEFNSGTGNVAVGYNALNKLSGGSLGVLTGGRYNVGVGYNALANNFYAENSIAIGYRAFFGPTGTTGADFNPDNIAIGTEALVNAASFRGARNIAIGYQAGYKNTAGVAGVPNTVTDSIAVGSGARVTNNLGIAIGKDAHAANGSIAIGYSARHANTAIGSIAIGYSARVDSTGSGSAGIAIGRGAIAVNDAVAIGSGAIAQNGSIAIGAGAVSLWSPPPSPGASGCSGCSNSGTGEIKLQAMNNLRVARRDLGDDWHGPSDRRLKKDITDLDLGLAFIEKLRPVSYRMKGSNGGPLSFGFIAQEVEKALDGRETSIIARLQDEMKTYIMSKGALIPSIVKAVQEIAARLNPLEKTVAAQSAKIEALEKLVKEEREISAQQQAKIQALAKIVEGMTTDKALPKQVNYHR